MRLQLAVLGVAALVVASPRAHADGSVSLRGVYYKERSTRVEQPMLDGMFEVGARGLVTGHLLVDAITSASAGSGAADAQPFTERRYEAGLGYTRELDAPSNLTIVDRLRLGGEGKYSTESDYRSIYLGVRGEADLAQKNAVLGLGGGVSADTVNAAGAQSAMGGIQLHCDSLSSVTMDDCPLTTYSGFASLSQIVSKNAVVAVTYDLAKSHGFQANPYRSVIAGATTVAEKHPDDRLRQSVAVSGRYFINASQTSLVAAYRYYRDDWKIHAHTPEVRIIQQVGSVADASVRYRYYHQSASYFYEKRYASSDPAMNPTPYFTDDPKMSAFTGHIFEAKLGITGEAFQLGGKWRGARFEGVLEYIVQNNRFGNALVAHVAITVPFDY